MQETTGRTLDPVPPVTIPGTGHIVDEGVDVVVGDAGQLHRQPGGKGDVAVAELLGSLAEALHLLGGEDAVLGDNPAGEFLGPAVEQKAQALDPFDILFQKCHCTSFFLVLSQLFLIILLVIPWVK